MKISVNWLQDYVDLSGITAQEMADKLTQITCEVEEVVEIGRGLESVVVGKILTCAAHPQSDHLHLLTVDIAAGEPLKIVCGAPNARAGLIVAVATVGTVMPDGMKIERAKIRGAESCGMCCSYRELGYKDDNDGIIELPATTKLGLPITQVLPGLQDAIIDIDNKSITNRPDLWGHYGIARELAVIFDRPFQDLALKAQNTVHTYDQLPKLDITLENENCLSYGVMKVTNLGGIISPDIIQNRLYKLGHNSHGFLVDITNYVMFAFGNPIHAFDATKIGRLAIGTIPENTKFITLKDNEIKATPEMLFIKSDQQPVALAGVMGGKNSEITPTTQDVVLEVATFKAANIRRTSVAVGIRSDASMRYEKALDPETNWLAMGALIDLIKQYAPQAKFVSAYTRVTNGEQRVVNPIINLSVAQLNRVTGVDFSDKMDLVERKLTALGFAPQINQEQITVSVPSWRSWRDITTAADVIEEIVRNYGYQNITPVAPVVAIAPVPRDYAAVSKEQIKNMLAFKFAFAEVHTNIWYDTKALKALQISPNSYATIANPFNKEDNQIRSSLLPSMLTVAWNNKLQPNVRVFEIGRIINAQGIEEEHLSGVVLGDVYKAASEMLTEIFARLGLTLTYRLQAASEPALHPVNQAQIFIQGQNVGLIGIVHPKVLTNAVGFEINLSALDFAAVSPSLAPVLSKFPKTELDFTFVWEQTYDQLQAIFDQYHNALVSGYRLKSIYANKFTLTFTVCSYEKTLDKTEIGKIHQEIVDFASAHSVHLNR